MHPALARTDHRPWPLDHTNWAWRQTWRNLAFIHYRFSPAALRPLIPPDLELEEFDGSAWVGVVPFEMFDVMRGWWPSLPPLRAFPELNVRTYVRRNGKPGVWFMSLDAGCWPIVFGGRRYFNLPYYRARMSHRRGSDAFDFSSRRLRGGFDFQARFAPAGNAFEATAGTFEHWIAERYCLYCHFRGQTHRVDVHHLPWPLQRAEVEIRQLDMPAAPFWKPDAAEPVCHFSTGVSVVSFMPVVAA